MKNESDNVASASVAPLRNMDFYRSIPAGTALIETLNEMVDEGLLSKEDAWSLLVLKTLCFAVNLFLLIAYILFTLSIVCRLHTMKMFNSASARTPAYNQG